MGILLPRGIDLGGDICTCECHITGHGHIGKCCTTIVKPVQIPSVQEVKYVQPVTSSGVKPYFQDGAVTIYHGDCREILPTLAPVDLVLTSPPYNIGASHHTGNIRHSPYSDALPEADYQSSQVKILNLLWSVTERSGSLLYNHKNRIKDGLQISPYRWIFQTQWLDKQEVVWFNGSPNFDKIRFYPMTERFYWLVKDASTVMENVAGLKDLESWDAEGTKGEHTRAFPIEAARQLIGCFPSAQTILDPFMGSGTTLRAAKDLGRKAIGIEIEERYCEIAAKRMSQQVMPL